MVRRYAFHGIDTPDTLEHHLASKMIGREVGCECRLQFKLLAEIDQVIALLHYSQRNCISDGEKEDLHERTFS